MSLDDLFCFTVLFSFAHQAQTLVNMGAYDGAQVGSTPPAVRPTGTFLPHRVLPTVRRRGQACGNPCHAPARGGAKREALAGTENRFRERVSERVLDWEFGAWCVRAHQACTREQGACKGSRTPLVKRQVWRFQLAVHELSTKKTIYICILIIPHPPGELRPAMPIGV